MKFGLFYSHACPRPWDETSDQVKLQQALEQDRPRPAVRRQPGVGHQLDAVGHCRCQPPAPNHLPSHGAQVYHRRHM